MNITIPDNKSLQDLQDLAQMMLRRRDDYSEESLALANALADATPAPDFRLVFDPDNPRTPFSLTHPDGWKINSGNGYSRDYLEKHGHTYLPPESEPPKNVTVTVPADATDAQILAAVREVLTA